MKINEKITALSYEAEKNAKAQFENIERICEYNTIKVMTAFSENNVSAECLAGSTGYGYSDKGRDVLDRVFACVFGCEDALVRHNFVSGTHALTVALFGLLRSGDTMLSVTGTPYDTLEEVIGIRGESNIGSLKDYNISYKGVELIDGEKFDYVSIKENLSDSKIKLVFIQRSRGYGQRKALSISQIEEICAFVKEIRDDVKIMVDNCYGEFVEEKEPCQVGADIVVGSLIKNAGGGMCETGGYIAGKKECVEKCAYRLTAPGIGKECGATLDQQKLIYKGLFFAPHIVAQAVKVAVFTSALYELLGFDVSPKLSESRSDIIQTVNFGNENNLLNFCKGIQFGSPVDSYVTPEAWDMPGYENPVVMAAGAFVQGASIELSADGPIKPPYTAFMQGGLTYHSGKYGVMLAASMLID